jgi:hypothetical protein
MKQGSIVLAILVVCSLSGCHHTQPPPRTVPEEGETRSFRNTVTPEPVPTRGKLDFNPSLLPPGARGRFSSFDGEAFAVNIPPKQSGDLTASQVFADTISPLVKAMGYGNRLGELTAGTPAGDKLPKTDLSQLATQTCREVARDEYKRYQPVCNALMTGESNPTAERVLGLAYGMTVAQFRADIERQRIQYVFSQRAGNVPIEHAALVAQRNDGEAVTTVHGTIFNRYGITNSVKLKPEEAVKAAQEQVLGFKGIDPKGGLDVPRRRIELVLLPYGAAADGSTGMRYAYRTLLFAKAVKRSGWLSWMAWIDAQSGAILELAPQFDDLAAQGLTWRRDPTTPTQPRSFQVDPAAGGQYTLQLTGVFNRFDRLGNGTFGDSEVSISDSSGGSTATFANFNQAPINDFANALCSAGGNNTFRQVNAYAHLWSFRQMLISAGTFPTFPEAAVTVWTDLDQPGNSSGYDQVGPGQSRLNLSTGGLGFTDPACPDAAGVLTPAPDPGGVLSATNDPTGMTHEFTHLSTKRLQERRPADWCGMAPCSLPSSSPRTAFHDYADAWAHHYASTPCMGGWYRKNMGGANASLNCLTSNEAGGLPRLSTVDEPFDPADVLDHFPEKRASQTGDYANGQTVAAAMWLTRQGMRSRCLPSGTPQTWVRINRALYNAGFINPTCGGIACDRDIYRFAQNLLQQMAQQWATAGLPGGPPGFAHNGASTTNKLLSGWARAGIFLVPYTCIDGDASTGDPTFCPVASGGELGADAIVDVRDNDSGDDVTIDGIVHPELDWSKRGDVLPTFRVWTGPRFKFDASGVANTFTPSMATPSPCNTKFRVEMASDEAFTINVVNSPWTDVSATTQPQCYGTWTPNAADWTTLGGLTGDVKVYYRVRTRDAADMNEKISTSPGSGSYSVPPPYVIVNDLGRP